MSVVVDDPLEPLEIEVYREGLEGEIAELRETNHRLRRRLSRRRRDFAVEAGTAGAFATAGVALAVASGVEPLFSACVALVAMVGAAFGLVKIMTRPTPTLDDDGQV